MRELAIVSPALAARARAWTWERADAHLGRLARHARSLSRRRFDRDLRVVVESDGARLPPEQFAPFWSAAIHLVRNAVDHGIEGPGERLAKGKPATGELVLRAAVEDDAFVVEIADDGRGVDWARVRDRARQRGLPCDTKQDLESALFADGLSTRDTADEVSGRGVGLGATLAACRALGGRVDVFSEVSRGTRVRVVLPIAVRLAA